MKIKTIGALDLAVLVAIFEFFALLLVGIFGVDNTVIGDLVSKLGYGFIIGVMTTVPALLIFNNTPLKIDMDHKRITKIGILGFSIANGIFLAVSFFIESMIVRIKLFNLVLGNLIVGFVTMFLTIFILVSIYNLQGFKLKLFIKKWVRLDNVSWFSLALFVAVIESFILPIMVLLMTLSDNPLWFATAGLISGFVGVYLATIIYNKLFSSKVLLSIELG